MTGDDFDKLVAPIRELIAKKGEDYNSSVSLEQYFPFGDKSYIQMIHMKALRLVSLAEIEEPNFESAFDTVQDAIAYCVFYLAYLKAINE